MHAYLWTTIIIGAIGSIARAALIMCAEYPRRTPVSLGTDMITLLLNLGFLGWAIYLLATTTF